MIVDRSGFTFALVTTSHGHDADGKHIEHSSEGIIHEPIDHDGILTHA